MDTDRNSVESQLRTRCNILESQVETLEKQKSKSPEKFVINDAIQAELWKEVVEIGRFPAHREPDLIFTKSFHHHDQGEPNG